VVDTRALPPRERAGMWAERTSEALFPMTIRPDSDRPFRARLVADELGAVAVCRVTGDPNVCARTRRDIAAGDPEMLRVLVLRHGLTQVEQAGRSCTISDGDVVVYDSSRPFVVHARRPFDLVLSRLPAAVLGGHGDRLRRLAATRRLTSPTRSLPCRGRSPAPRSRPARRASSGGSRPTSIGTSAIPRSAAGASARPSAARPAT
jgi:hypothetical protein